MEGKKIVDGKVGRKGKFVCLVKERRGGKEKWVEKIGMKPTKFFFYLFNKTIFNI